MSKPAFRTYGAAHFDKLTNHWVIDQVEPHVAMTLKSIFRRIRPSEVAPFRLKADLETCSTLLWFTQRYPLIISDGDARMLKKQDTHYKQVIVERENIFTMPISERPNLKLKNLTPRAYQLQAAEFLLSTKRYLLGDTQGLGKTLSAILSMLYADTWPAAVGLDAQVTLQWKQVIETETDLKVHIVKKGSFYELPPADVYLFSYMKLQGWADIFATGAFPMVVFDEIASLRRGTTSEKGLAAKVLADHAEYVLGLSGTPIYNYGEEIYTIIHNYIRPGSLGTIDEFHREWCVPGDSRIIKEPKALGAYLRETHIMLRRTRKEVMGDTNTPFIDVIEVDHDEDEAKSFEERIKQLAMSTLSGGDMHFRDAGEFSLRLRQLTGIVKARSVAAYARMLVESGEPVILAAWHREVYDIYLKELADLKPVMFTGSEDIRQKERNKQAFMSGESDLMILSLRSGIGVDGFQHRCAYMIFGELDFSPQIHSQVITRIDRPGQKREVSIAFLVCQYGSDPVMQQLLGLKRDQSEGIMNPFTDDLQQAETMGEEQVSRIKQLAKDYLTRKGIALPDAAGEADTNKEHAA